MPGQDLTPLFGLRLRTPRLELRLPTEPELRQIAHVAERGVHPPGQMPFLVPWTDGIGSPSFVEDFVDYHRGVRASWAPGDWHLELGVWAAGSPIGIQVIQAEEFERDRTTSSASWIGSEFQGVGYGTEMRSAVLDLAFAGLGAVAAESGALEGNVASARVSAKLGYGDAGEHWPLVRGRPVRERLFRIERERWTQSEHVPVEIAGLEPCLSLFGLGR
jgi:RimJ/RimL family protein N-acetyltransferase